MKFNSHSPTYIRKRQLYAKLAHFREAAAPLDEAARQRAITEYFEHGGVIHKCPPGFGMGEPGNE